MGVGLNHRHSLTYSLNTNTHAELNVLIDKAKPVNMNGKSGLVDNQKHSRVSKKASCSIDSFDKAKLVVAGDRSDSSFSIVSRC